MQAARNTGPRHTLTGQPLPPLFPVVAAAQADGAISVRHAQVIITTIDALPEQVQAEHGPLLEDAFVAEARTMDPAQLAQRARMVTDRLDPDGTYADADYRARRRSLTVHPNADGSAHLTGDLTAELAELLDIVCDSLAAPQPAGDGDRDRRTPAQRRHDALLDALKRLAAGGLPEAGGCPATLIVTIPLEAYLGGRSLAVTGHNRLLPAEHAVAWAGGDARVLGVVLNDLHEVTHYSGTHRIFTANQRLAMTARDRGCTFPSCDAPPGWCEAHHVTDYAITGTTSIDDGAWPAPSTTARPSAKAGPPP